MSSNRKKLTKDNLNQPGRPSLRSRAKMPLLSIATALSIALGSASCNNNITEERLCKEYQKTEELKGSYNSTYDSRESLKMQLREIEEKLNNPNLNKTERRELEKQRKGIAGEIKSLNDDMDEYFSKWKKAVNKYTKDKAKYRGKSTQNENIDSSPNNVDGRLQSVPSPDE